MNQEKLEELFNSLTIEDKIGQLVQLSGSFFNQKEGLVTGPAAKLKIDQEFIWKTGSIVNSYGAKTIMDMQKAYLDKSKTKIPLLFMADIINGCRTIFPISLGQGAMFDPELVKRTAEIAAIEASALGLHVTFSPMVDLVRDARWGRVMETYGEDTYLNCLYAKAMVEGYQGNLNPHKNIAACVKHFAGYGAPIAGREYNTVELSERMLHESYLPSYKAAIDAGCCLVMSSFNTLDGVPVTGNKKVLREILRDDWKFEGVVISDHSAIRELIAHGVAKDDKEAAQLAMEAGCDIDMLSAVYANELPALVEEGKVDITLINEAVMNILSLKNKLGLFENPYRGANQENEKSLHLCKEHRDVAKEVVSKSCVLLKNKNRILPLAKDTRVALIGPYADNTNISGMWSFGIDPKTVSTLKKGFEAISETVQVAQGCSLLDETTVFESFNVAANQTNSNGSNPKVALEHAICIAKAADVLVLALGEHPQQSGEGGARGELDLPNVQMNLLREMKKLNKPIITLLFSGRPLVVNEIEALSDGLLECWYPGIEGGNGIAELIYGMVNPSGKLTMTFPYAVGQCPIFYNECHTGRAPSKFGPSSRFTSRYVDIPNEPKYVFGYGLSYSDFKIQNLTLDKTILTNDSCIYASVEVMNESEIAGVETVQLYIQDCVGSVTRPKKELKGFIKVALQAHERKKVTFAIREDMLRFIRLDMEYASEEGDFKVYIGANSEDTLETKFSLVNE